MKKSIFIYGSCVSRDVIRVNNDLFDLIDYYARSSWISASSDRIRFPADKSRLESNFQNRMLQRDFMSMAFSALRDKVADFYLLDLVDERFGVFPTANSYITQINELNRSGLLKHITHDALVEFGSDVHFELFRKSALENLDLLTRSNLYVIQHRWADTSLERNDVPLQLGRTSQEWQDLYERYFNLLRNLNINIISVPDYLCISTINHKWGLAPFHYIDDFYTYVATTLLS
ncbi:DUF6270 domain-containing protein [Rothia sp. LK2588]|uniref:DUF6270 domain-containing protein n=1 Tax=Rothia sp. LK2588 TaxID=3114369 RepID=UPI0034CE22E9